LKVTNRFVVLSSLGLAHGISDGIAGYLIANLFIIFSTSLAGPLTLLYNLLAFGLQPVAGLLIDRFNVPKGGLLVGLSLATLAWVLLPFQPVLSVVLIGLGSAVIHSSGGGLALTLTPGKARGIGIFAAPGVLGLALGAQLPQSGIKIFLPVLIGLLVLMMLILIIEDGHNLISTPASSIGIAGYEWTLIALCGAVAIRSMLWTGVVTGTGGNAIYGLRIALAAALGKITSGFFADRIGWKNWVLASLILAVPILEISSNRSHDAPGWGMLMGIFLLQSTIPVMLAMLFFMLPRQPAFSAGLGLGLATIIGGLPIFVGFASRLALPSVVIFSILLTLGLFVVSLNYPSLKDQPTDIV
jgi:MFS transporter, FSR family, fosmidomycin resistance protein